MANELIVIPRKLNQPIRGDKMQFEGAAVRTGTDNRVDAGNSDTYVATDGVEYVELFATAALWYRITDAGAVSSDAEVGKDEYLPTAYSRKVAIRPAQVIKCVLHS